MHVSVFGVGLSNRMRRLSGDPHDGVRMTQKCAGGSNADSLIAHRFDRIKTLAQSPAGTVFSATCVLPPWPNVAVKVLSEMASDADRFLFRKKYRLMARCLHSNLMPVSHLFLDAARNWIGYAMPLITQWQLTLPVSNLHRFVSIAKSLCAAVDYLHRLGYLAGTLCTDQLLFSGDPLGNPDHTHLINYGYSITEDGFSDVSKIRDVSRIAPEIIRGAPETIAIDLYGLGVLLYELATGRTPFAGTVGQIIKKHLNETPPSPGFDPGVDAIIGRLLAKEPHIRYRTAQDALADFDRLVPERSPHRITSDLLQGEGEFCGRESQFDRVESILKSEESSSDCANLIWIEGILGAGKTRFIRELAATKSGLGWETFSILTLSDWQDSMRWLAQFASPQMHYLICVDADDDFSVLIPSINEWNEHDHNCNVLVVVTVPDYVLITPQSLYSPNLSSSQVIRFRRLSGDAVGRIVGSYLLAQTLPSELLNSILYLSGGFPLFIEAAVRYLHRAGALEFDDKWIFHHDRVPRNQFPPLISEYILDLLSDLHESERYLLLTMAVCGEAANSQILDRVSSSGYREIVTRHIRTGILIAGDSATDASLLAHFAHLAIPQILIQTAAHDQLFSLYQQIARTLTDCGWEGELPARMFLQCDAFQDAALAAIKAVDRFIRANDSDTACRLLRDLEPYLEEITPPIRAAILARLAGIELDRGHGALALRYCDQANDESQRAEFQRIRGLVFMYRCDFSRAQHELTAGLTQPKITVFQKTQLLLSLGQIELLLGHPKEAREVLRQLLLLDSESGDDDKRPFDVLEALISAYSGEPWHALDMLQTDHISLEPGFFRYSIQRMLLVAEWMIDQGNFINASTHLDHIREYLDRQDMQPEKAVLLRLKASVAIHRMELNSAEEFLDQAINLNVRFERKIEEIPALILRARVRQTQGKTDSARDDLTDILRQCETMQCVTLVHSCRVALAQVMLDRADYESARYQLDRCVQSSLNSGFRYDWMHVSVLQAYLLWSVNQIADVKQILTTFDELSTGQIGFDPLIHSLILQSHCARLERHVSFAQSQLRIAREKAEICGALNLAAWIDLAQIRLIIDSDLSESVWFQVIKIWDRLKRLPNQKLKIETALVTAKLAFRRGDVRNASRLLDSAIGMARQSGYREHHWRGLRLMAQILYSQRLTSQAYQTLALARDVLSQILASITLRQMAISYQNRPDVQAIQLMFEDIEQIHRTSYEAGELLPAVTLEEDAEPLRIGLLGERYRLFHQAATGIRSQLHIDKIVDLMIDTAMKLTGSSRGVAILFDERGIERTVCRNRIDAPEFQINELVNSKMVRDVIDGRERITIRDTRHDSRFAEDPFIASLNSVALLCTPLRSRQSIPGLICLESSTTEAGMLVENSSLIQDLADESAMAIESTRMYTEQNEVFMGVVRALSSAVDAKDPYTYGHSSRVSQYAQQVGAELGLGQDELRKLELAALLHDIGKIGISQSILDSPHVLNPDERHTVSFHPEIGAQILTPIKKFKRIWTAVHQHHERYDGKGYPNRLRGTEIELFGRILAVADALDAMTTNRPYQKAISLAAATEQLRIHSGSQFDPEIVATVERMLLKGTLVSAARTGD